MVKAALMARFQKFIVDLPSIVRSEEHTSELSHGYISYAVFCLKKKNTKRTEEYGYSPPRPANHSYRKLSTRRTRTPARPSTIVAAIELPLAPLAIHPSSKALRL